MARSHPTLNAILLAWSQGEVLDSVTWQWLEAETLADPSRAQAFDITPDNVRVVLEARSQLFQAVYADFQNLCQNTLQIQQPLLIPLWDLWLPLAMQLAQYRQAQDRPIVQGILGSQGTGKTTLGAVLTLILKHLGSQALSLSLDDLYKTYAERQQLQLQDPRLIWRGPPGTHDIELGLAVLDQLRHPAAYNSADHHSIEVPRFDKSAFNGVGDRTTPDITKDVDIVLFEGWFVGVRPINPAQFEMAPPPIRTEADRTFARDINSRLEDYLPLWERLDRLMVLYLPDYRLSLQWRRQAEHQLIASGKSGMSDANLDQFVEYFWRSLHPELFIKPLIQNPELVDLVIEINPNHLPGAVYRPA